jgi:hypothetical protein
VTSQIEMTNRAPKSSNEVNLHVQEG